ncbi:MAG: hypothetical protein RIS88_2168 [Pseudomonadota bacterium]|jgi:hypothetical protein
MTDLQRFTDARAEGERIACLLRTTQAVRERCGQVLAWTRAGHSPWFEVDDDALEAAARRVATLTRQLQAGQGGPIAGCWRRFAAGGVDRRTWLERLLAADPPEQRTHARIDLALVCEYLGQAPEGDWSYTEAATGQVLTGREGLAVALWHAFCAGLFSSDPQRPLQADAAGLRGVVTDHLGRALQAGQAWPGLHACVIALRRLGEVLSEQPEVFGEAGRPSGLFDTLISPYGVAVPHTADVRAHDILSQLLITLSGLTPGGAQVGGVALGDCWGHPAAQGADAAEGWVPLHAGMQAITCALLEPFEWAGVQVRELSALTAPADVLHGNLLLDTVVLRLRDPQTARPVWPRDAQIVIEWRALTVALLEELAPRVQHHRGQGDGGLGTAGLLIGRLEPAARALALLRPVGHPALHVRDGLHVL